MDAKSLAKSKRAHTLHHSKKHHPHHTASSKGTSAKSSGDKSAINVKSHNALPSNWDRYDLGSEEEQATAAEPSGAVVPKSKGADYAYLISEAKSQYQSRSVPNHSSSELLDDDFTFLTQGFGSLLSARGQNLLSWIQDDVFELEDRNESTSFEVPFLSLNLDGLAQQLSKSKLSRRLFIPPEVLPSELLDDELQASAKDKSDPLASASALAKDFQTSSCVSSDGQNMNDTQHHREPMLSSSTSGQTLHIQTSEIETKPAKKIELNTRESPISEAANAEAELDMLLNSFGEVEISKSSDIPSIDDVSDNAVMRGTNLKKVVSSYDATSIDDDIDRLLEETSIPAKIDDRAQLDQVKSTPEHASSTLYGASKSKLEDDFDSWLDTI